MAKRKVTPVLSCPNCWKVLEMVEQETFQTKADSRVAIKYFTLRCKDCAVESYFEEDSDEFYDDKPHTKWTGDRMFMARVELYRTDIQWTSRIRIVPKKPKKPNAP